jgi:hypothetical protein
MELYPSEEDPIAELLPCDAVLGAFILRGPHERRGVGADRGSEEQREVINGPDLPLIILSGRPP